MPRTVLLADDSVTAQNMGRRILTDAGYEVITVNNGSAALKKIHENPPDLIVLDVYMPGYGGLEICQRLKESGETMKIPVLLTVGKMEPFKSDDAKRVSADGHIVKPFDATELLAALTRLEDRIVPQSAPTRQGSKQVEKTKWFWHGDPAPASEPAGSPAKAESKNRKKQSAISDGSSSSETESAINSDKRSEPAKPQRDMFSSKPAALIPDIYTAETLELPLQVALDAINSPRQAEMPVESREPADKELATEFSVDGEPTPSSPETTSSEQSDEGQNLSLPEPAPPSAPKAARWVAEKVEVTVEEAAVSLEEEMRQQQAALVAREDQPQVSSDAAQSQSAAPGLEADEAATEAVTAAAPSASGESVRCPAENAAENEPPQVEPPSAAQAAWENWHRIRESVLETSELLAKVAEVAQPAANDESKPTAAAPALEGEALASIVDSVLAELKPRLMEEIVKKLAQDKK